MKRTKQSRPLNALLGLTLLASTTLANSEIHAFVGNPTDGGVVRSYVDGSGLPLPSHPELRGLQLLPLDFNGRLSRDLLLSTAARHRADIDGAGRIELPSDKGVLYRFRRVTSGPGQQFGFLHVGPSGELKLLAERAGIGPLGDRDPYLERIALRADGERFLAMTTRAAGGNLIDIEIATGQWTDRTATSAPFQFRAQSARLLDDWCVAVTGGGVLRCVFSAGDQALPVPLDGTPAFFSGELVMSAGSTQALLTAGESPSLLHAWVLGQTGDGRRVTRVPAALSGAGYLPEAIHGPFLAVADDGVLCAWRVEGVNSREVFARRSTAPDSVDATLLTGNGNFTDTLDEAGVLNMAQIGALVMAVGEVGTDPGVGIEKADFFEVTLDGGGAPTIRNITLTSGQLTPPFQAIPSMTPLFLRWLPTTQTFVGFDEQGGGTGRLVELDFASGGVRVLRSDIKEVFFLERVGDVLLASVRLSTGEKPHQLLSFPVDLNGPPSLLLDTGDNELRDPVVDEAGWIAIKEVPELGLQRLWRWNTGTSQPVVFPLPVEKLGPVLAWSGAGDLTFSFDRNGAKVFAAWPRMGAPYRLRASNPMGAILAGR